MVRTTDECPAIIFQTMSNLNVMKTATARDSNYL